MLGLGDKMKYHNVIDQIGPTLISILPQYSTSGTVMT